MTEATLNLHVTDYTNRVLGVIKEMFGLKNKSEALNKFAELFGDEFVGKDVREDVIKDIIRSCDEHAKKHGTRRMSLSELKTLSGAE
jgi:hypothetical protein